MYGRHRSPPAAPGPDPSNPGEDQSVKSQRPTPTAITVSGQIHGRIDAIRTARGLFVIAAPPSISGGGHAGPLLGAWGRVKGPA